jgi:hypothetical protein
LSHTPGPSMFAIALYATRALDLLLVALVFTALS